MGDARGVRGFGDCDCGSDGGWLYSRAAAAAARATDGELGRAFAGVSF